MVCYFWVILTDLSQKEDDLVSAKIKILNLRNALWWTSKKFWCNNLFATVTTTFNMFPNIFLQTTLLCMVLTTKNGAKGFQLFFVYFSLDSTHISMNENGFYSCLTKSWIGLLFLSTLVDWAYLEKTWRHLLDTIYQEQIDSYLAHLPGSDITPSEMIEQENETQTVTQLSFLDYTHSKEWL